MTNDTILLKKWMIGAIGTIILATASVVVWMSDIEHDVETMLNTTDRLERSVERVSSMQSQFLGSLNSINQTIEEKTVDRWHRSDQVNYMKAHDKEHTFIDKQIETLTGP